MKLNQNMNPSGMAGAESGIPTGGAVPSTETPVKSGDMAMTGGIAVNFTNTIRSMTADCVSDDIDLFKPTNANNFP